MQKSKDSIFQSLSFFSLAFSIVFLIGVSGCENPGSVGSGLTPPGSDVVVDTLAANGLDTVQVNALAGARSYFSAGQFNDPLFGDMSAIGLTEPRLPAAGDSIHPDDKMMMRIILNKGEVYGDSVASQDFDIYEIGEYWKFTDRRLKDDIKINTGQKVGSFSVGNEDSLDVTLSHDWYSKYYDYATDSSLPASEADSAFQHNVYGLALVAQNSNKIIPLNATSTHFVITSQDSDTVSVKMAKWGYSLSRSNESYPEHSLPLYSTYESIFHLKLGLNGVEIQPSTISKTELIFYQNNSSMEQSLQSEPSTVQRPPEKNMNLYVFADSLNIAENIDPVNPIVQGTYESADGAYHLDITTLTQQILLDNVPEGQTFYVAFSNNGVITPSLIYSDSAQTKMPKIVITHLKNNSK